MQYDVKTATEYLKALDHDWRRQTLEQLRLLIQEQAPALQEGITYKMLSYSDEDGMVFGLNAQKQYVSFYVGDADKIDASGLLLEGLERGKGCIRFKKKVVVAETKIAKFIARTVELRRSGADVGC